MWGYMAAGRIGNFEFIDETMDKFGYLDIFKSNLKQSAEKLGLSREDSDPKHTAGGFNFCFQNNSTTTPGSEPNKVSMNDIGKKNNS